MFLAGKKSPKYSTLDRAGDQTGNLGIARQRSYRPLRGRVTALYVFNTTRVKPFSPIGSAQRCKLGCVNADGGPHFHCPWCPKLFEKACRLRRHVARQHHHEVRLATYFLSCNLQWVEVFTFDVGSKYKSRKHTCQQSRFYLDSFDF